MHTRNVHMYRAHITCSEDHEKECICGTLPEHA